MDVCKRMWDCVYVFICGCVIGCMSDCRVKKRHELLELLIFTNIDFLYSKIPINCTHFPWMLQFMVFCLYILSYIFLCYFHYKATKMFAVICLMRLKCACLQANHVAEFCDCSGLVLWLNAAPGFSSDFQVKRSVPFYSTLQLSDHRSWMTYPWRRI